MQHTIDTMFSMSCSQPAAVTALPISAPIHLSELLIFQASFLDDELALDVYERALDLNLGRSADSFFLRKMSEEYLRIGDEATAQICFNESEKLKY